MRKISNRIIGMFSLGFVFFLLNGCASNESKETKNGTSPISSVEKLFTKIPASQSGLNFINTLTETDSFNMFVFEYIYNGGGVAVADINQDGLPDIFLTSNQSSSQLFLNEGNFRFKNITQSAGVITDGWCTGITAADVNGDGLLDFYICRSNPLNPPAQRENLLFINNGNLTFTESAKSYGLNNPGFSTQATFFDYDLDNDLDMFLAQHPIKNDQNINNRIERNRKYNSDLSDHLYRNNGNQTFTDVTLKAGVGSYAFSLSTSITDINEDGWPDIYVSNDYIMPDFLYINNKNGTFTEKLYSYFRHTSHFSMGSDVGDINNDGLLDLIQLDMLPEDHYRQKIMGGPINHDRYASLIKNGYGDQLMKNSLQLNNGNGSYSEIAELAGISKTDWSWSPLMADFDNDGFKDIYITNGYLRDVTNMDFIMYRYEEMRQKKGPFNAGLQMLNTAPSVKLANYIYKNEGNLIFTNKAIEWGLDDKVTSTGAMYADLDRDGDLDIIVNNINDSLLVYQNNASKQTDHQYLSIRFEGEGKNKFGIGAKVVLTDSTSQQIMENYSTRGYLSATESKLHFGLGKRNSIKKIEVKWPDGKSQILTDVKPNVEIVFKQKDAIKAKPEKPSPKNLLFTDVTNASKLKFIHTENDFNDFKNEPLLPHKFSQNGPGIAVGDVNGDGEDDFYVGGAMNQAGKLFVQKSGGTFEAMPGKAFETDKLHEDMSPLFFDSDSDGDLDLIVSSGGSEVYTLSEYYQTRLYTNDGKGNFSRDMKALPIHRMSTSCISACDFDFDGDLDLFVGGRLIAGNYPMSPQSNLWRNDGGRFTDVTQEIAPELKFCGLVCSSLWTDFNQDGKMDLIVLGEWMNVTMFENKNGKLVNVTTSAGLDKSSGWWNSIVSADFDKDGDIDYALGNFGLNNKIKTSIAQPAKVYAKDFDKNGTMDAILCFTYPDGVSYPIYSRDDLTDQIRPLKKKLIRFSDYANKTMEQIFSAEELKDAKILYSHTFASSYLRNDGKGKFTLIALPIEAQFSPTFGMLAEDYDADGNVDILLTGNSYATEPEIERHDAGNGLFLKGDGKGNFIAINCTKSGFYTPRDAKAMVRLTLQKGSRELILVSNNNSEIQGFERDKNSLSKNILTLEKLDVKYEVYFKDGKKSIAEVSCGSGYLSQSSRKIRIPDGADYVTVFNSQGKSRKVSF